MRHFVGCDPDNKKMSLAIVNDLGDLVGLYVAKEKCKKGTKGNFVAKQMCTKGLLRLVLQVDIDNVVAFAVEGQEVSYTANTGARPQDIVDLAVSAGGVLTLLSARFPKADPHFPKPFAWKGSVKKNIHQNRTMRKAGIEYETKGGKDPYPVPVSGQVEHLYFGPDKINPGDWKDIADSVGLALWAKDQWYKEAGKK